MPTEPASASRRMARSQESLNDSLDLDSSGILEVTESGVGLNHGFELREDPSFWKDHNVQVVIRIRPLSSSEISLQGQNRCVRQDSCQTLTWIGHPESRFTFDLIADEHASQERLFNVAGVPMVENCMAGYNSCMFAYGQTGSGKTHTMLGDIEGGIQRNSVNCGMTPRVFEYLFSRIHKEKETQSCQKLHVTCRCSFLEIYNEQILDLLDPSSINLQLREDAKRGVYVENLKEYEVSSPRDVIQQLIQGAANRKVAATNMNRASSRSHSVFTCVIERKWESQGVAHHRFARLNLVDLAGSERQKSSGAEGDRLKEATNINKSLSTLGLVIMNLVSSSGKRQLHVPYRDSKLTFLLQDSLGGNSKTMIIANISPSNCCSLETLSTLKFAQRAKFIRNNAIVNEEASGDVLTMRIQIQQLKKEVNRLKGLINNGPDNLESDSRIASAQASPGIFKWNGDQASFSPLTFDKRLSPRKEHEAALVAALRRNHDKEEELKALETEREAADKLVIHRTEEAKSLKLRLRFREDEIRRLKALASGKLSPETLFSQEREDLLKEVEVLRNQVDRNPEVTRFALENMQLREELRRLKSFVEDGEREMMNEQITVLQDKLLEALDWKLMHEKNTEGHPLLSWDSSVSEENEFLRLEAIQNQREAEALRKNLTFCLQVKENLERRVEELMSQVEEQMKAEDRGKQSQNQNLDAESDDQMELKTMVDAIAQRRADAESHDQLELKTMVDAIAAASQREAEAHETAITLARENDELHMKLKILIEDNENLIKLHEFDSVKASIKSPGDVIPAESTREIHEYASVNAAVNETCVFLTESTQEVHEFSSVKAVVNETGDVFPAGSTLELHEFASVKATINETGDVFPVFPAESTRKTHEFASGKAAINATGDVFPAESTLELQNSFADFHGDGQESEHHDYLEDKVEKLEHQFNEILEENEKLMGLYEKAMQERDNFKRMLAAYEHARIEVRDEINCPEKLVEVDEGRISQAQNAKEFIEEHGQHELSEEMLSAIRTKLDLIEDKFSPTWEVVNFFGLLEKAASELEATCSSCEDVDCNIISKQQEIIGLGLALSNLEDTRTVTYNKLFALKTALRSVSSKFHYWEEREYRVKVRYESCLAPLDLKKEELRRLYVIKNEMDTSCMHAKQSEIELRSNIDLLKVQLQAREAQRKESERVLFSIDNLDRNSLSEPCALNFGKASELLKSEEERTKIAVEIKKLREKLVTVQKELTTSHSITESLNTKIENVEALIRSESALLQETELAWRRVSGEKLMICKMIEDGMIELGSIFIEYHECLFGVDLKRGEILLLEEELQLEMKGREDLGAMQKVAAENLRSLLEDNKNRLSMIDSEDCSNFASEKIEKQFRQALWSLTDVKKLLLSGGR